MISVLIPVYNFNATKLFESLVEQGKLIKENVEIITYDDHSTLYKSENKKKANELGLTYKYLSKNLGRSRIRNAMAKIARNDFLLFIDGDIIPKSKKFIENYIKSITQDTEVIYGGRIHQYESKYKHNLRWKYGYFKEDKTVLERSKKPYLSIITNNLLIKKTLFTEIQFDETISTYGHEDTLFAYKLKKIKAKIEHTENTVIHLDIDTNALFISKTEKALENLKIISDSNAIPSEEIKLLAAYDKLKAIRLTGVFAKIFTSFQASIKDRLLSHKNTLLLFTIYKLGYFCKIKKA